MKKLTRATRAVLGVCVLVSTAHAQSFPIYRQDNVLVGANFNDGPGSSDMTLIMRIDSNLDDEVAWVDEGHEVKFIVNPDNDGIEEGWTQIVYDDSEWDDGQAGVGFSDGDDNTVTAGGLISIWTRYYFDIQDAATVTNLTFRVEYDDQFAAWLNGVLISSSADVGGKFGEDEEPAWDLTMDPAGPNHGSKELPAGEPNLDRWADGGQESVELDFDYAGQTALSVDPQGKLTTTWSHLRATQ
ncbi:MAG: hypothetical protein ABGY41_19285 [Candidatus Poribacteria bacterium]|jgi:hypothetical protein